MADFDLNSLLPKQLHLPSAPAPQATTGDNFLEDLLAGSMKAREESRRIEQNKKLMRSTAMEPRERAETESAIARWEAERLWTPQADSALFQLQTCLTCGSESTQFLGIFQRQSNRNMRADRWAKVDGEHENTGLPKEVKYENSYVRLCHTCAPLSGYPAKGVMV